MYGVITDFRCSFSFLNSAQTYSCSVIPTSVDALLGSPNQSAR